MLERARALLLAAPLLAACSSADPAPTNPVDASVTDGATSAHDGSASIVDASDASDASAPSPDASDASSEAFDADDASPETDAKVLAPCTDLSNVGKGDFNLLMGLVQTTLTTPAALAHQRASCTAPYWEIHMTKSGTFVANLSDGKTTCQLGPSPPENDGHTHAIALGRVNGVLHLEVDGMGPSAPCGVDFGQLPPVSFDADPCIAGTVLVDPDAGAFSFSCYD